MTCTHKDGLRPQRTNRMEMMVPCGCGDDVAFNTKCYAIFVAFILLVMGVALWLAL